MKIDKLLLKTVFFKLKNTTIVFSTMILLFIVHFYSSDFKNSYLNLIVIFAFSYLITFIYFYFFDKSFLNKFKINKNGISYNLFQEIKTIKRADIKDTFANKKKEIFLIITTKKVFTINSNCISELELFDITANIKDIKKSVFSSKYPIIMILAYQIFLITNIYYSKILIYACSFIYFIALFFYLFQNIRQKNPKLRIIQNIITSTFFGIILVVGVFINS